MAGRTLSPVQPIRAIQESLDLDMPPPKETQPGYTEIVFVVLAALTWQLLSWFGRFQHGRVPALLWVLVALFLAFSYSITFKGRWLRKAAWRSPRHWLYWPAGIVSGAAGSCAVVISQAMTKKPPAPHDPRLSWAIIAVTVAPVVEELLFRGALLTGLLYILGALRIRSNVNVFLSILFAALAFGFAHLGRTGTPLLATILMGMVYGWLRVRSASTPVAAAAHSAYNLVLQFFPL
jgi:membrane protease YdiL (CAAX protease family)